MQEVESFTVDRTSSKQTPPPIPSCYPTYPPPSSKIGNTLQPQLYSPYSIFPLNQTPHSNVTLLLCSHNSLFFQIVRLGMQHPIVSSLPVPHRQERKYSHTLGVTAVCLRRGTSGIGSQLMKHKCVMTYCILHLNDMLMLIIIRSILPAVAYAFQGGPLSLV